MSEGEPEAAAAAVPGARRLRGARVRSFVANRSGPQRIGVGLAVLLLLTAPFGGLRSEAKADVVPLRLDQRIDLGPIYLTITKVRQLKSLEPAISPDERTDRLLVVAATITNHSDRAEQVDLATDALAGTHTGAVAWADTGDIGLKTFSVDDATELPRSQTVNPGLTYHLALVLQQRADTDLDQLTLEVYGYHFRADDPQTLDPDAWIPDQVPLAEGHVPIETGPAGS